MQIVLIFRSFVLTPVHTCRSTAQQCSGEQSQHCWATRTTGVPDACSSVRFMPAVWTYMWHP